MNNEKRLQDLIRTALKEDIGAGDHSTLSCIKKDAQGSAVLKIKEDCIIAGVSVAEKIFRFVQEDVEFKPLVKDGKKVRNGDIAFKINAKIHTILSCERLVLNCMQRMSGIASLTKEYVDELKGYKTKLLDTRKTTPNFRLLEKEAVRIGGGNNHRFGLYDMIMLKDNHIDYSGGIKNAIERANKYLTDKKLSLPIEIEARNIEDVKEIMSIGKVNRILLDNFSPVDIKKAMKIIGRKYETEASGGITLKNIKKYAETGVTYISTGATIHQAKSVDLSLKAELK
jgi:nicotinate-nucleotide pyrophosphorylase (carboxylating)